MASADLLLHPVRLRIIKAFLGEPALTTADLAAQLDDVPPASLYRHVATLAKAGVLAVVAERRVRGSVERTYTLRPAAGRVRPAEYSAMTGEEQANAFLAYVAGMLADFDRYLASGPPAPDPVRDGVAYRVAGIWLTDTEYAKFCRELSAATQSRLANTPGDGRRKRLLYTVLMPAPQTPKGNP